MRHCVSVAACRVIRKLITDDVHIRSVGPSIATERVRVASDVPAPTAERLRRFRWNHRRRRRVCDSQGRVNVDTRGGRRIVGNRVVGRQRRQRVVFVGRELLASGLEVGREFQPLSVSPRLSHVPGRPTNRPGGAEDDGGPRFPVPVGRDGRHVIGPSEREQSGHEYRGCHRHAEDAGTKTKVVRITELGFFQDTTYSVFDLLPDRVEVSPTKEGFRVVKNMIFFFFARNKRIRVGDSSRCRPRR